MAVVIMKDASFKAGQTLTFGGVPNPNASRFSVNIGPSQEDRALHVDVRFDHLQDIKKIVCNTCQGGYWGEEHREGDFPFHHGEKFKMTIKFNPTEFLVTLPDGYTFPFPNRMGAEEYLVITAYHDVRTTCIEIK